MLTLADTIIQENIEQLRTLLQFGVNVNEIDEYGFTPLIEAAIADNIEIAKLLIQYGANVNLSDAIGGTPLHWAVENNNIELCKELLRNGANPNAYNLAGQPVLAMPLLRHQRELKQLLYQYGADLRFGQDYINTKLLGHMFELTGTAFLIDPRNQFVEVNFEGFFLEFSIGLILESLSQFHNHFAARELRHLSPLTQVAISVLDRAASLIKYHHYRINVDKYRSRIDDLIDEDPVVIPVAYEGHAITFIKAGEVFIKCDRREDSRLYDNIVFYHVGAPGRLTVDFIRDLIYEKHDDDYVNSELPQILRLQPITELKVEAQISGNCSWANVEACIPALIFLLQSSANDFESQMSRYKGIALNYFHRWREWNKTRALQFCIQSFQHADTIRNVCKAEILAAILFQRCDPQLPQDKERIQAILSILTQPAYEHVLQNYIRVYLFESVSEEGKRFAELLKAHGYTLYKR